MPTTKKPAETPKPKHKSTGPFPEYKGKPLVREGDAIYFGYMSDPFIAVLNVVNEKNGVADTLRVQLMNTDPKVNPLEAVVKNGERKGLYAALDLALEWIERA